MYFNYKKKKKKPGQWLDESCSNVLGATKAVERAGSFKQTTEVFFLQVFYHVNFPSLESEDM